MKLVDAVFGTLLYITTTSSRSSSIPLRASACPLLYLASIRATASSGKRILLFLLNCERIETGYIRNYEDLNTYGAICSFPPDCLIAVVDRLLWWRESGSEPIAQMASSSVSSYVVTQIIPITRVGRPRACRARSRVNQVTRVRNVYTSGVHARYPSSFLVYINLFFINAR